MSSYHSSKSHYGTCTSGEYKVTEKFVCWSRFFCELVMLLGWIDLFSLYILFSQFRTCDLLKGNYCLFPCYKLCLQNYAHASRTTFEKTVLWGNIACCEMGKQSKQAKKVYREEKSLHHVAMAAKFVDLNVWWSYRKELINS